MDLSYSGVLSRKKDTLKRATGIDYGKFEISPIAFNYEGLMRTCEYSLEDSMGIIERDRSRSDTPG